MTTSVRPVPKTPLAVAGRQATFELRLLLRNGEQFLLTVVIPLVLLVGLSLTTFISISLPAEASSRVEGVLPGILALAVMSTSFTALAISTGFDRRSAALKFLASTPVQRQGLVRAKVLATLAVVAGQTLLLVCVAAVLGWRPGGAALAALILMALGVAAFATFALLLAGTVRAEATLAGANAIYLFLLIAGGVVVPLTQYPEPMAAVLRLTPSGALGEGLREAMISGVWPWWAIAVLSVWAAAGGFLAGRYFKWQP